MSKLVKLLNDCDDIINTISNFSIIDLEELIQYSADKYYNSAKSVISDSIYDVLIDFLKIKNPKSKVLKLVGAKVKSKKVKLDYWLGSMDKIKPNTNQLNIWTKKYKSYYNLSDKLDGISALLVYTVDNKIKLFTRGDGIEGQDISNLVKYLELPNWDDINKYVKSRKIKSDYPNNIIAFRGELIISNKIDASNKLIVLALITFSRFSIHFSNIFIPRA
jgi:NAD-dependent DNA ligase